jgi:hypothetical protein
MAGVGGAAVPGRLSLAGTEARPTKIFSYKRAIKRFVILRAAKNLPFLAAEILHSAALRSE